MSETLPPNTTIAQYTIVSQIGEGGMGEVYRARDTKFGRDVDASGSVNNVMLGKPSVPKRGSVGSSIQLKWSYS